MSRNLISLDALELLDAIDRRGSFAKAAEELDKATSALSYGVQKLEEQLGVTIFVRQGRRSVLTPAGRLILEEGRKILAAAARVADKAKELATGWEPRLRVGVEWMLDQQIFFEVLAGFQNQHPDVELDVCETVLNGGWEALEHHRIDLLVGAPGPVPSHMGFRAIPIGAADLIPVISERHPLAHQAKSSSDAGIGLESFRRVITHDTSRTNITRSEGLSVSSTHTIYVQTSEQKNAAILNGLGVGHLPRHRIEKYLSSGQLIELSIEPSNPENYVAWVLTNKGKALAALSQLMANAAW